MLTLDVHVQVHHGRIGRILLARLRLRPVDTASKRHQLTVEGGVNLPACVLLETEMHVGCRENEEFGANGDQNTAATV
jgi:hypothetical protein